MIYTYHHIKFKIKDTITITPIRFFLDMLLLLRKKVVFLEDYNPNDSKMVVLTFDDGYKDFLKYAFPILKFFKYPFEIFVCGDFISDNGYYLSMKDLEFISNNGGKIQYHTKSHKDLSKLTSPEDILEEITLPESLKKIICKQKFLAYPYWNCNKLVEQLLIQEGYTKGLGGTGSASDYTWERIKKG